jgi:uncharacterized membrane protein
MKIEKSRLEAFSDGVIAIIITITVLELKVPQGANPSALRSVAPVFLSYLLSFIFLGIYWTNHHHLFMAVNKVNGLVLWANLHLLFWLSLTPFATSWMGENSFSALPVAVYGSVLLLTGFAYFILERILVALHGEDSPLAIAVGQEIKGSISLVAYLVAIPLAFLNSSVSLIVYFLIAAMWIIPDPRIEKVLTG